MVSCHLIQNTLGSVLGLFRVIKAETKLTNNLQAVISWIAQLYHSYFMGMSWLSQLSHTLTDISWLSDTSAEPTQHAHTLTLHLANIS